MKVVITVERTVHQVATVELDAGEQDDQWELFETAALAASASDTWKTTETHVSKTRSVCRVVDSGLVAP